MKVPEKFLEDYIFETPDWELEEDGLYLNHAWIKQVRQMNLGKHGRADIIRFCKNMEYCGVPNERKEYNDFHIEIIELKKGIIDTHTIAQAAKYMHAIRQYLIKRRSIIDPFYTIYLIGRTVSEEAILTASLLWESDDLRIIPYTYNYVDERFWFEPVLFDKKGLIE